MKKRTNMKTQTKVKKKLTADRRFKRALDAYMDADDILKLVEIERAAAKESLNAAAQKATAMWNERFFETGKVDYRLVLPTA